MAEFWVPKDGEALWMIESDLRGKITIREQNCTCPKFWVVHSLLNLIFPLSGRDKAEARCTELNKLAKEALKPKRWKPGRNEEFWSVEMGRVNNRVNCGECSPCSGAHETGNCFRTKEEAEEYARDLKVWSLKRAEEKANG